MRLLATVIGHEWRLQAPSLRFRFGLLAYLLLASAPPLALLAARRTLLTPPTAGAYLWHTLQVTPFLTVLWAVLVAGNTARVEGEALVLLNAPASSSGWTVCKLAALLTVVLPPTVLVMVTPVVAARLADTAPLPTTNAATSWLLVVVPLALVGTLGWYGLVRVLRSEVAAFLVAAFGARAVELGLDQLLAPFDLRIVVAGWTGFDRFVGWFRVLGLLAGDQRFSAYNVIASDAPIGIPETMSQLVPWLAAPAAGALVAVALAAARLGRSRPDRPPRREAGGHPAPNLVRALDRLREQLQADAGRGARERVIQTLSLFAALLLLLAPIARARDWLQVAAERYRVETGAAGAATSLDLAPARVRVEGELSRSGSLKLSAESVFENRGRATHARLAFELDRHLRLSALEVPGHEATIHRSWNRVELELSPPIAPGERLALRYRLGGTPRIDAIDLQRLPNEGFAPAYERHRDARFARDRSALASSRSIPEASGRSVGLDATDLMLRPRWQSWELTPPSRTDRSARSVPEETHHPRVELELDLAVPDGWVLADGCGGLSQPGSAGARLRSRCRIGFDEIVLAGGRRTVVSSPSGEALFATLSGHERLTTDTLSAMARVVALSDRAWSDLPGLERVVAVETSWRSPLEPPSFRINRRTAESYGPLIGFPEERLLGVEPLPVPELVASILTQRLVLRREPVPKERRLVPAVLRTILLRRMGLGAESAWVSPKIWESWRLERPVAGASDLDAAIWGKKVPAILRTLEHRVGTRALMLGAERFVTREGPERVSVRDLLAEIERESRVSLDGFYEAFFVRPSLPNLSIEDLSVQRDGRGWTVAGTLRNAGSGEALCPVVVRGERGETPLEVRVGSHESTAFEITVPSRPHSVALDPDRVCYQFAWTPKRHVFDLDGADS